MTENENSKQKVLFRREAMDRISSPEQLTDYLRVSNPGVWVILAAVILLLAGILVWSTVGTLETKTDVRVIVEDRTALVVPLGPETLAEGMPLEAAGRDYVLNSASEDDYGRPYGTAEVDLPDGAYDGKVVTDSVRPITFLLTSR